MYICILKQRIRRNHIFLKLILLPFFHITDLRVKVVRLEDEPGLMAKYNIPARAGGDRSMPKEGRCTNCRKKMQERLRPNADRCAAVDDARRLGVSVTYSMSRVFVLLSCEEGPNCQRLFSNLQFAVENRQTKESQPKCLCPYCGHTGNENIRTHAKRHEDVDQGRLVTYCNAMFSRNARGPVNILQLASDIKMAIQENDDDAALHQVLENAFHSVGVATGKSECSTAPLYDMKKVFLKDAVRIAC